MALSLALGHLNAFPSHSFLPLAVPRSAHIPSSCPLPVPKPVQPKSHVNSACFHLDLGYTCMRLLSAISQLSSANLPLLGCAQALKVSTLLLQPEVLLHGWDRKSHLAHAMQVEEENLRALFSQYKELINVSRLPETFSSSCKSGKYPDISVSWVGWAKPLGIVSGQLVFKHC